MKARIFMSVTVLALGLGLVGSLYATPITGSNTRPVTISAPAAGEASVQAILDATFGAGVVNAADQQAAAVFSTAGIPPFANLFPQLAAEYSSLKNSQGFGLWSGVDTGGTITRIPIFNGPASSPVLAMVQWTDADTVQILGGPGVNSGIFHGVPYNFFGFYYQFDLGGIKTVYSYDGLNASLPLGTAGVLAYKTPNGDSWAFFCDDLVVDADYNDMVVKVESIHAAAAVPIPGSVFLVGSGLLGTAGLYVRRKKA